MEKGYVRFVGGGQADHAEEFSGWQGRNLKRGFIPSIRSIKMSRDQNRGRNPTPERDLLVVMDPSAELKLLFLGNSRFGWIISHETNLCL